MLEWVLDLAMNYLININILKLFCFGQAPVVGETYSRTLVTAATQW